MVSPGSGPAVELALPKPPDEPLAAYPNALEEFPDQLPEAVPELFPGAPPKLPSESLSEPLPDS